MCLIALHWQPGADPALIVVANRDEQHARPSAPLGFWDDAPQVLAGRDLEAGGSWMGVNRQGRFAALTNIREPQKPSGRLSRGLLVADFLRPESPPCSAFEYAQQVQAHGQDYAGFNLLVGDASQLVHVSNRDAATPRHVPPGTHGLSNALLDTPWPKLNAVTQGLDEALAAQAAPDQLLDLMQRREPFPDDQLPDTGVGRSLERLLSPPFICTPVYGTRGTTWLQLGRTQAQMLERRFKPDGAVAGESRHSLRLDSGAD